MDTSDTESTLAELERLLCGDEGSSVLHTLARLGSGAPLSEEERGNVSLLAKLDLGAESDRGFEPNLLGMKCADAAREYVFWVERNRLLHSEGEWPQLELAAFQDKDVLEIGSGWGCNLFRLQQVTSSAVGCEIEPVYRRFTGIFAKIEGVDAPKVDLGAGEQLPYEDESFDCILMFSALQYMNARAAVREVARVLRPGGSFISSQPMFNEIVAYASGTVRRPYSLRNTLIDLTNSLSYEVLNRRVFGNRPSYSTARPVYLTQRKLVSLLAAAGLDVQPGSTVPSDGFSPVIVDKRP